MLLPYLKYLNNLTKLFPDPRRSCLTYYGGGEDEQDTPPVQEDTSPHGCGLLGGGLLQPGTGLSLDWPGLLAGGDWPPPHLELPGSCQGAGM